MKTSREILDELVSKVGASGQLSPEDLPLLRRAAIEVGYAADEVSERIAGAPEQLMRDARERIRVGSRKLMSAIAKSSIHELTACLNDPVPYHREIAQIELTKLMKRKGEEH